METMNNKVLLIPFLVALTLLLVGFVSADELATSGSLKTEFNSIVLSQTSDVSVSVGNTIPVRATFTADKDASDVKVKVSIEGLKEDVQDSTKRFDLIAGKTYTKLLALEVPSSIKGKTKDITLYVEIINSNDRTEEDYTITLQRDSYELDILSIDYNTQVTGGDVFPVSVVIKNTGYSRMDDNYVVASIPELGVSSRNYAGDLIPVEDYQDYDDEEDSVNKVVYLQVPEGAPEGVYELVVRVYNSDAVTEITKLISVQESQTTTVLASSKSQDVSAGETAKYELIIVNTAKTAKVFRIDTISGSDLIITTPTVIAVGAGESKTVTVIAEVPKGTDEGTYTFSTDVEGKQTVFAAHVIGSNGSTVSSSIVGLTVVLVIVFVVLLAVLIILISRKDNSVEEVETSYY